MRLRCDFGFFFWFGFCGWVVVDFLVWVLVVGVWLWWVSSVMFCCCHLVGFGLLPVVLCFNYLEFGVCCVAWVVFLSVVVWFWILGW